MKGYALAIHKLLGVSDEYLLKRIEEKMRDLCHSTLDWQPLEQWDALAFEALQEVRDEVIADLEPVDIIELFEAVEQREREKTDL